MNKTVKKGAIAKKTATRSRTTPARQKLTVQQQRFVDVLLTDENMIGTTAYEIAFKNHNKAACAVGASRLLSLAKVKQAIEKGMKARAERVQFGQDQMFKMLVSMVNADVNDIMQFRRTCCRHCHGINFGFQWKDENEFERATQQAEIDAGDEGVPIYPTDDGGYGYNEKADPHEDCPKCGGDGYGHTHYNDTRYLTGGARLLYAGVEQTKEGIKVKSIDKLAVADKIMRHLGMFNDKLTLKGDPDNPLIGLLNSLPGATLKPVDEGD